GSAFSFNFWIKVSNLDLVSPNEFERIEWRIVQNGDEVGFSYWLDMVHEPGADQMSIVSKANHQSYPTGCWSGPTDYGSTSANIGGWQMITFLANGSSTMVYVNGNLLSNQQGSELASRYLNQANEPLALGGVYLHDMDQGCDTPAGLSSQNNYYLDNLRLYSRMLSASEIQDLYSAGL
ncbi:MAG: LamG-like jellyroll fold domain-containing protein, partial [Bacteroidota bacterium]